MNKIVFSAIFSLLSLISNARELISFNSVSTTNSLEIKKALILLLSKGLINRDVNTGKYIILSSDASSLLNLSNVQIIDMDSLEEEMKVTHKTDF